MFDLILKGGWIVDGTGAPPFRADLAVTAGRIKAVSALDQAEAGQVVDVAGRYLMPGFVDAHVHTDARIRDTDTQLAALRQGITTVILGQDGVSFAPASRETLRFVSRYFGAVNGHCPPELAQGCSVADLLAYYDRSTALNTAYLAPAGTIRAEVMGLTGRRPEVRELDAMRTLVERALADGAVGVSSGMVYVPNVYSDAGEIASLCRPAAAVGAPYVTHMRGYEARAWVGMAEVRDIAHRAGVAAHVSHYHGPANMLALLVDQARGEGLDVTFDTYPYQRGSTILSMLALPPDIQQAGPDATLRRLADPAQRRRLVEDWFPGLEDMFDRITLSYVAEPGWSWCEGMALPAAAAKAGQPVGEFICELLVQSGLEVGCVVLQPPTNTDGDVRALLRHEAHMASSDGIFLGSRPHPRGWGAFARLLGRHTRELGDWTWGMAALHLAGHACRRFGLSGRGLLRPDYAADIVVVDPLRVGDRATFDNPRQAAEGIDQVLVNGVFVLRDGSLTGEKTGRVLHFGKVA